jgi:predicted naringenin-chalcone synthase
MRFFEDHAIELAALAVERLAADMGAGVTHLIVASCTGFYAPGLDLQLVQRLGLGAGVERTLLGFMGCQAAIPALKLATHIVRSRSEARVLIVNLELCTIHLQETDDLARLLSFVIFGDGCTASIVSGQPEGYEITGFGTTILPASSGQITWRIGDSGFDMWLDGEIPKTIARNLTRDAVGTALRRQSADIGTWAIHPGGRSILDAVQDALELDDDALAASRGVLHDYGNMSSATVMFVLDRMARQGKADGDGCAIAFGPGITAEMMGFRMQAGRA